jgi:hypothetical protein
MRERRSWREACVRYLGACCHDALLLSLLSLAGEILEGIRGKRSWDSLETADEEGGDGIGISTDHILQSRHHTIA